MGIKVDEAKTVSPEKTVCNFQKNKLIAIGIVPTGYISIGIVPMGVVAIGIVPMGLISFGAVAMGTIATGLVSMGVLAIGGETMSLVNLGRWQVGSITIKAEPHGQGESPNSHQHHH